MVRFFHWLFTWRVIRRTLIVLAWTATIIALLYGEENWRGRRAWNKYRHELEARGEQLDLKAFIPKPVPDEQNFAATPFIQSWFKKMNDDKQWEDIYDRAAARVPSSQDKSPRRFVDLGAWQMAFEAMRSGQTSQHQKFESDRFDTESRATAAPAVLQGLETSEPRLAELRAASRRPYSRYPVIYDLENPWGILLPHLAKVKGACARLQLKSCAELAIGQGTSALEAVKLMLYLVDSIKEEPFLISHLVRIACLKIATQPIWEGLAQHRWSEAQLRELQSRLQQYNFVADLKRPLEAERACGILTVELIRKRLDQLFVLSDGPSPTHASLSFASLIGRIVPSGWYYQEQFNYCRLYELQLGGTLDASESRVWPRRIASNAHELEREISGGRLGRPLGAILRHRVVASLLLPALDKAIRRTAAAQTAARPAV